MDGHALSQIDESILLDEAVEAPPMVRFDERRMHIRAYNYWASLLGDRQLPSIEDLNPAEIEDFGSHSVLLDFTCGVDNPSIAFMGTALATQCDISTSVDRISQIPPRTLLSRLTDHYLQIIANAAPIGFEAEFTNQRGNEIMYRGIMMPFSSDGDTIDFVYGVINWKEMASDLVSDAIAAEIEAAGRPDAPSSLVARPPVWTHASDAYRADDRDDDEAHASQALPDALGEDELLELTLEHRVEAPDADASLDDCLAAAREAAAAATASEGRTRHALYQAIGLAHAFALAARIRPDDYAEILADAGIAVQPRSPMTALAKLIFGVHYDKTRLTEFVCAIDYALEQNMAPGALVDHLRFLPGGLKALVAQVRAAKRNDAAPAPAKPSGPSKARRSLVKASALDSGTWSCDDNGLAIVVMRREPDGSHVPVATLAQDDRLTERVFAAAARALK